MDLKLKDNLLFSLGSTISSSITSSCTTAYVKDCPNVSGINILRQCTNLTRVRLDIGNVTSSLQELLSYSTYGGYNDDYEEQTKPRLVGTWTINYYYTNAMLAAAQASFDGLTIVEDTAYNWETMLANDLVAVQTIDSTAQNYNPAAAIVLQSKSKGVTLDFPIINNGGRWFITKAQAAALTGTGSDTMGRWFNAVTTKTDTNGIVTSDTTAVYTFDRFNEFRYFTGQTSIGNTSATTMNFYSSTNLKYLTTPGTITSFNRYSNKAATNNNQVFYLNEVNSPSTLTFASATDTYFIQYSKTSNRYILSAYKDKYKGLNVYEHWLAVRNVLTPVFRTYYQYCAPQISYDGTDVTITVERTSTIYYTTDGSTPTIESTEYTEPFAWNGSGVIKAMAIDTTNLVGDIAYADDFYAATAQDPVITNNASIVTITAESGATIYYTIDGSCPNTDSDIYEGALSFDSDFAKIRCFARVEGKNDSNVVGKLCVLDDSLWGTDGDSSSFAVQSIDSTKPNYNPAVGIILFNNGKYTDFLYGCGGYLTKTDAAAITNIGTTQQSGTINNFWFKEKTTVSNNHFIAGSYDFETFNEFKYFTSVTLYSGYTASITGEFGKCTKLKSIIIPSHITVIYKLMFTGCSILEDLSGIDNVVTISEYAFSGCEKLKLTSLPSGLTSIQGSAFNNCKAVTFNELPAGVSTIPGNATANRCFGNTISIPYLHLLKDGVVHNNLNYARQHTHSNFYGTTYKIYVGNGNQAHDEALLADYQTEGSWSALFSSLDTWYNYLQANP